MSPALRRAVPSDGLPEVSSNEGTRYSEERGYSEAGRLIRPRVKELRNYSCQKAYEQRPKNTDQDLQYRCCYKRNRLF